MKHAWREHDIADPGSYVAIKDGCTCAQMDNHYGKGRPLHGGMEVRYITNQYCPLHGEYA